jgi:preprotein translocase subunit SecE
MGAKPQASGAAAITVDSPEPKKPRTSPGQFFSQVRAEGRKIVWPSRKEAMQMTAYVFAFVAIMSIFLWATDKTLEWVFFDLILGWRK